MPATIVATIRAVLEFILIRIDLLQCDMSKAQEQIGQQLAYAVAHQNSDRCPLAKAQIKPLTIPSTSHALPHE
jgi:hypothetical protein